MNLSVEHGERPQWRLSVLNPGGRDPEQDFPDAAGSPDDPAAPHPPINHHAYAACTRGTFHARTSAAIDTGRPILLLLRRDLGASLRVLKRLRAANRVVAVTFKEAGAVQIAARLGSAADLRLLETILKTANGAVAPTPQLEAFFNELRGTAGNAPGAPSAFVPTPYPVEDERWNFSRPFDQRRGIFIGTREFAAPARQHLAAVLAGRHLHGVTREPVTVINTEGRKGARLLEELGFSAAPGSPLRRLEGPLGYTAYLREMAAHRLVFQLDRSAVPGQVAGDALLCRLPCVGGDGAVEEIAFPDLCGRCMGPEQLVEIVTALLTDAGLNEQACQESQRRALDHLSFRAAARRLEAFYRSLAAGGS